MKKLYLVDVSSLFFRAYYAIPSMSTSEGLPTNALYGFFSMSVKLLREIKPDYMVYCFDRKEASFRAKKYKEYKANRGEMPDDLEPQIPYIKKLTDLLGICRMDKKSYEADDVIGSLSQWGKKKKLEVVIVSGDKDFAQLIGPHVTMYDPMREVTYDEKGALEKWGVPPKQMIDYLALVGDASDNIPGVSGVGVKTAQRLLSEYKTLNQVFKNAHKVKGEALKRNLSEGEEKAYLSQELVTICKDLALGATLKSVGLQTLDRKKLEDMLDTLEFQSFKKKIFGSEKGSKSSPSSSSKSKKKESGGKGGEKNTVVSSDILIWEAKDLDKNLEPYKEVWGIQTERGLFLAFQKQVVELKGSLSQIGKVLDKKKISWKGFDVKNLWRELELTDPMVKEDLMLSAYILKAGSMEDLAKVFKNFVHRSLPDLASPNQMYKCYLELEAVLTKRLEKAKQRKVLKEMELPLVPVLYSMEKIGIRLDVEVLKKQGQEVKGEISKLEKIIYKETGHTFNIASTKQLSQVLFDYMGLPVMKKTKTGYSTGSDVLQKLAPQYPVCEKLLEYRELAKLQSTYIEALPHLVNPRTKRIHTSFRQAVTTTGRLSSVNPNLQNIPIRTLKGRRIREAFKASPGHVLLSIDYSQIELRILAHITEDKGLCEAFKKQRDIHIATASGIYKVPYEKVTSDLRRAGKAVNYGIAYGQGAFGLAESLGIPRGEAKKIITNYFERFIGVKKYMKDVVKQAYERGYVETLFGRRRYIEELKSKNAAVRSFGERAAINAPMQGTSSDLMKKAMIAVWESVSVPMVLQVHDELLLDCPKDKADEVGIQVQEIMENIVSFKVPLKANVIKGRHWAAAHE